LPINLDKLNANYSGNIKGNAREILTPPGILSNSQFIWSGDITRNTAHIVRLGSKGQLDIQTDAFRFSDPVRARDLAKTLTLSDAISKTLITK